jgi:hypothetical protein
MNVRLLIGVVCLVALAPAARAQLVGPIPPATPPTPAYTPPPKLDVPDIEPAPVEPPAPSIVARDDKGILKPITGTPEEAAVAAYSFEAKRREKIAASAAARKLDLDRFIITNLDKALAAEKMRDRVQTESEFSKMKAEIVTVAMRFERLIDRLERDRAITAAQRVRLDETLLAYDRARQEEIDKQAGDDPTRKGVLNLRQTFADAMREPMESLERQMRDVAEHLFDPASAFKLRPDQEGTLAALRAESPTSKANIDRQKMKIVRELLDLEQQRAAMTARLAARATPK